MSLPEDEVLRHALGKLFAAPPTDLPRRVLHELRRLDSTREAQPLHREWRWIRSLAAAAALVVCAWTIATQFAGDDRESVTQVATATETIDVLRPGSPQEHEQSEFGIGDTLVNGPERERDITLANGDTLTLGPCAMLTLEEREGELLLAPRMGSTTVSTAGTSPLRIRTSLGTVVLQAPATVRVDLVVDGYDLEHPDEFRQLSKELHMKAAFPFILTVATLLEGSAMLENADVTRPLPLGVSLQDQGLALSAKEVAGHLLREVGTWNLTATQFDGNGERSEPIQGVEVCSAGPGDKWLITDMTLTMGDRKISMHTVVGYDPRKQSYTGSLVDSFGGETGLLKGEPKGIDEPRTLIMYSAVGTPGFDSRWRMTWEGPSRRRTEIEALQGEEWVLIREIVHELAK